jgi:hypothetical protein
MDILVATVLSIEIAHNESRWRSIERDVLFVHPLLVDSTVWS